MRIADFIEARLPDILSEWDAFASSLLPAARGLDAKALRDHAEQMLAAIVLDLRTEQTRAQEKEKSNGLREREARAGESAAQTHAMLRAQAGFDIRQLVAEYRALRASVLRLWSTSHPHADHSVDDIGRFNEAIDQAITESVDYFAKEIDRWRNVFLGVLGHDLRGPLNAVLLTCEVLSQRSTSDEALDHLARMSRGGQRMKELLDDLLDYSRTSLGVGIPICRAPMDAAEACREELDLIGAAHPNARIRFDAQGDTQGTWDRSRIRQVLSNLVLNAVKYGAPGTVIDVEARGTATALHLVVLNAGPVIPESRLQTLFDPMTRGSQVADVDERGSLGLGLFIVRQIARAHGGEATAQSSADGIRFEVTLPRTAGDVPISAAQPCA